MIQLSYLDYSAVEGKSFLHRLSPVLKVLGMLLVLFAIVTLRNLPGLFLLYVILIAFFFMARVPWKIFSLTLYPLIFAILFIFLSGFQILFILLICLKVLCGSTGVVLLLASTSYPSIFSILGRILPSSFVMALFLTYRSIFILLTILEETQHALYLRGGVQWTHPWRSLINISNAFGHLIIKGIDASEKMYESMMLRGFEGKIHYRGER
ncbi:MAG TPA: energy-coupling factor transporter transmembrane component T [Thermodesulfobacteriota bacterium]|nr:energy-coupling factor transporter transmembrane component T [Thermodesulfobacteriota bacterium]